MDGLVSFSLPIQGLRDGVHEFHFDIDREFFQSFEGAPISEGKLELTLTLEKRPSIMVLEFDFSGVVQTECDRCLAGINLPIEGIQRLVIKYSEEEQMEDAEVIYIHPEAQELQVARFAYEYIILAIPMIRVYDCEDEHPRPCNMEMLSLLEDQGVSESEEEDTDNPIWQELKKLKDKS